MKTPREILLQKHAAASKQLDQIRTDVVNSLARRTLAQRPITESAVWPGWAEFFWSVRGHLTALAGAWVLIAVLNSYTGADRPLVATAGGNIAPAELLLIARENRLQMRELLRSAETTTTENAPPAPQLRPHAEPGAMWPVKINASC